MVTDIDFHTLIATLQRALDLRLTKSQRTKLKTLCQEIAGVEAESGIPLKEEADAKRGSDCTCSSRRTASEGTRG